jgi:nicotinamidase-related amidase
MADVGPTSLHRRNRRTPVGVRGLDRGEPAALIINECQNAIIDANYTLNEGLVGEITGRGVVQHIATLAEVCRRNGVLVVHSTMVLRPDGVGTASPCLLLGGLKKRGTAVEGHKGAEIVPDLAPRPQDHVSRRLHGLSPFHGTELEPVLRERGVRTVIITGVSTNVGVPGTCLEAVNRGFTAVVPEDCVAGSSREIHDFQIAHILPLLASISTAADVTAALDDSPRI